MEDFWKFTENLGEPVYVTDIDTYELVYMNKKLREMYNISSEQDYVGKKCYELIQRCAIPCTICNNKDLKPDYFREWMFFNPILGKTFSIKDTLIEQNGHRYRLEIAINVNPQEWKDSVVQDKNDFAALATEALRGALKKETPDETVKFLLEYIGNFFGSERTCVFEKQKDSTDSNIYEWCRVGVEPMKDKLQNIPPEVFANWYEIFTEDKHIVIKNLDDIKETDPLQYEIFKKQNIRTLVAVPLYDAGKIVGFYGVENPTEERFDRTSGVLQLIGHFIIASIRRRNLIARLQHEQRRRTEAAVRQEMTEVVATRTQENLDMINEIIGSGMWTVDFDENGEITHVNFSQKFREMLGYSDENDFPNVTDSWLNILHPDEKEEQRKAFWDAVLENKDYDVKYRAMKKNGEYAWFHGNGRITRYPNGKPRFFVGTFIDITEELKKKQALEDAYHAANRANAAKTEFLASMSHDIRTPLNAIIGMTAIAAANMDDKDKIQHCLSEITISSKHLLGLINEVLDMNKIESGKISLNESEFNLSNLIDDFVAVSKPLVKGKEHEFFIDIHDIKHENVIGDADRIQQSLMNFMSNAVKYTPDGGKIKLSITEKVTNKPKVGCYEFVFEDNGIGMSEDFVKIMFEPFARANDERAQKQQGTGLGMSITKNIVRMMNGSIQVESELNKGTKITTTLFLELQDTDEKHDYKSLVNLPILVADDDQSACESTCFVLNELGMLGEWVLTGKEAVEKVVARHEKNEDFFAVIIDWRMPDMDGIATTRAIRQKVGNDIPIIIISAYDWTDIEAEARDAGANGFISKPIFKSKVAHTLLKLSGKESKENEISPQNSLDKYRKEDFRGTKILLVEDNEINAEIAKEILEMTGLKVDIAWNGKEAVEIISASDDDFYKLIFMDIQMPIMNGYDATKKIRESERDYLKNIPIVAMSANAFVEDVIKSKSVGMNDHIAKPLDFEKLLAVLNKWVMK